MSFQQRPGGGQVPPPGYPNGSSGFQGNGFGAIGPNNEGHGATYEAPVGPDQPVARLFMLSGDQVGREYGLVNSVTSLGRGANNDIVIADPKTSRRHMQIVVENGTYWAVDAGSANGFYLNEQQTQRAQLRPNDIITIGLVRMAFQLDGVGTSRPEPGATGQNNLTRRLDEAPNASTMQADGSPSPLPSSAPPSVIDESSLEHIDLRSRALTSIGREHSVNNVLLDNPQVSRRHVQLTNTSGQFKLADLNSTNGTFVNGQRVGQADLNDGDIINIGPYRFMFANGFLHRSQEDDSVRVDVLNLSKQVSAQLTLLHNVTFTILPREFVAIVGVSGSGKSTLMDAISGVRPATGGTVLYNKAEYYPQMEVYRSSIGYVPQDDIVSSELTVYKALYYAARLRLPQDTTEQELQERLEDVIDDLDLELRRNTRIGLLSGGQRKRVSIAAELISKPSLFFLDEPTSGLDPGLEGRMMQLLRKLADQGRTVVLITHATQNVELCDQVLFLARGGYVAFYGAPQAAKEYFGVERFSDIYIKLEQELTPEEWANRFVNSVHFNRNVEARLRAVAHEATQLGLQLPGPGGTGQYQAVVPSVPVTFRRVQAGLSGPAQYWLLVRRYFETLTKDSKNLMILLLQAPVIALMMVLVFQRKDWNRPGGDFGSAKTLVFLMVIVSVWFGTSNSAREIVKEAAIYRRERRIGLSLTSYIFSKLTVQTLLVLVQITLLVGIVVVGVGLGGPSLESLLYLWLTLVLTALAGVALGLLISAMTTNSDRATSFVPVVLIPQIIFSGAVVALDKMGPLGNAISTIMAAKWGYQTSGRILSLDTVPSTPVAFNGPPPEQANFIEAYFPGSVFFDRQKYEWFFVGKRQAEFNTDVFLQWGILGLMIGVALALIIVFQLRKDKNYSR